MQFRLYLLAFMHDIVNLALIYSWDEFKLKYLPYVNFTTGTEFPKSRF